LGFDVLTYKTILVRERAVLPFPNVHVLSASKIEVTLANSVGMGCGAPKAVSVDIATARASLQLGQLLLVSVYGEGTSWPEIREAFARAASLAKEAGAHMVELNLSCPNVAHGIAWDTEDVASLAAFVARQVGDLPLSVKVGVFSDPCKLRAWLCALARAGVRAVCGINSVKQPVLDAAGNPIFGATREYAGVSGAAIRPQAMAFVREAKRVIDEERLPLKLVATGGVMQAAHFREFLAAGADLALCATGAMWFPHVAMDFHRETYGTR